MSDANITFEKKPNILVRIAVIAGMLLILFFIAGAIVKYVPKIISSVNPGKTSDVSMSAESTATSTDESTSASVVGTHSQNPATLTGKPVTSTTPPDKTVTQTDTSTKKVASAQNYSYTNYSQTYIGPADLSISLSKVGQISGGSFIQTSSIQPGSRVQVQFLVTNSGGSATGPWYLNAVLPTTIGNQRIYNSISQPSIPKGASYQMTLAFDGYDGSSNIQITLNGTNDANSSNNLLIVPLTSNGNYNNSGCYWSSGYQYCNGNNYNNNNNCYWINGYNTCGNNYNSNNECYYLNGSYVCNNNYNNNNGCYWSGGFQYCGNNSYNNSDLSVVITNVGTMDRNTGQFYYSNGSTFNRYDKVAVQFTVTNTGNTSSGSWTYSTNFPSSNSTYSSNTQSSLSPGQTMSFTQGFDYPNTGSQTIGVNIYPQSGDSNSGNNYASRSVYINN